MALKKIHTVTVKPKTGSDGFGKATYGAEATFPARFNNEVKLHTDEKGLQINSVGTIYYDPADKELKVGDMAKHTGAFGEIVAIAEYPSANGSKQTNVAYLTDNVR